MSHAENEKAWIVPCILLLFCGAAVLLTAVITMSAIDIPPPAYSQTPPAQTAGTP